MSALTRVLVPSTNSLGGCPAWIFGSFQKTSAAIIVIQEFWGVNQSIKETTQKIGEETGCVTVVPDLYRGKVAEDRETAGHIMTGLNWSGAIEDIDSCARYLRTQGIKKVGVTGFCMGGALTIGMAALKSSVDAAAPFYGIPSKEVLHHDVGNIKIPIQCHFGKKDNHVGFSSPVEYEALRKRLEETKANFEFHVYDADHAFANPTSEAFDEEARDLSFSRMYKFFHDHLASDQ